MSRLKVSKSLRGVCDWPIRSGPVRGQPAPTCGAGRRIVAFGDALDEGPGAPGRATLYTGARGMGKTVMLNEAEAQARQRGWVTVSETSVPGLMERLVSNRLPEVAATLEMKRQGRS